MARGKSDVSLEKEKTKLSRESLKQALVAFQFIKPYKWSFFIGLILLFLSSMIFMVFPFLIGQLVDVAQGAEGFTYQNSISVLGLKEIDINFSLSSSLGDIGIGLILILLVQGAISYGRVLLFARVSEKGTADIRKALYQKLVSLPISFFEENKIGELISRITADIEKLFSAFSITLAEFLRQIIILIVGIAFLVGTNPRLSLIMLLTVPVVMVSAIFFGRIIRRFSKDKQKKQADSNAILGETMQAIRIVKAFVNENSEIRRYNLSIASMVSVAMKYAHSRAIFAVFIITTLFGAIFFIIWQGAVMVQEGAITTGNLISFVTYTGIIGASIGGLGNFVPELLGALGATERVREIMNMESELDLDKYPNIESKPIAGHIEFKDVNFHYPTRKDIPVLKGINMKIEAGESVALVGPSGVGKSTIIQLLLRFYSIQDGDILVDGESIYDTQLRDYRNNLALVPQEVILMSGSIRENILYGREGASEAEIIEAAKQSNSWEFIQQFPEGLDTIVGERGIKLSGGQRQRIAIARAILKNPAILLLDEATSSLDAESERVVQDALDKLMVGRTSIIIAHRLSTIKDVDKIYVLDEGTIVEQGTHKELVLIENGMYSGQAKLGGMTV